MTNSFRFWMVVVALLTGLMVAACGGGGDNNGNDDAGDGPAATVPSGNAGDANSDGAADGNPQQADDGSGSNQELSDLAAEFGVNEVKIDYNFSATGDGGGEDMTFTLYLKPPDAWRVDLSGAGEDAILITNDEGSYICAQDQCMESPLEGAFPVPFLGFMTDPSGLNDFIGENILGLDLNRSERKVAGEDATCFSANQSLEGATGSAEYCFRQDGILLLLSVGGSGLDGSGEFSLEATNVEDAVSDQDLVPPYPITDLSDLLE